MSIHPTVDPRLGEVVSSIQMPLENIAWTIQEYLLANGTRLDPETRFLLAGVRDGVDRVAGSVRRASMGATALAAEPEERKADAA